MAVPTLANASRWCFASVLIAGLSAACTNKPATNKPIATEIPSDPAQLLSYISTIRHSNLTLARKLAEQAYKKPKAGTAARWPWRFRMLEAAMLLDQADSSKDNDSKITEILSYPAPPDVPSDEAAARIDSVRGYAAARQLEWATALDLYNQAYARLASVHDDPCWKAELLVHHLAQNLRHPPTEKQLATALETLKQASDETKACPDKYFETLVPFVEGNVYNDRFYYEEAVRSFQSWLILAKRNGVSQPKGNVLGNLALSYSNLGDFDNALLALDQVDRYYEQLGNLNKKQLKDWGTHKGHRARIYFLINKFDAAAAAYKEAIQLGMQARDKDYLPRWQTELTSVYIEKGDYSSATALNQQALSDADFEKDAPVVEAAELNAARLARIEGDFPRAQKELSRHLPQEKKDLTIIWQFHIQRALVLAGMKDAREANREFKAALSTADSVRESIGADEYRLTCVRPLRNIYQSYVKFLVEQNQPGEALRVAEMSRARLLAEKLNQPIRQDSSTDFTRIARLKRAVILSYSTAPRRSYMWVTTAAATKVFPLPPEVQLTDLVSRHNEPILDERSLAEDQGGRDLYDLLIAPAADLITPGSNVIIVPDGPLSDLNFETLIPPGPHPRYWLQSAVVSVAPSLTLLLAQEQNAIEPKSVLAVGDAVQAEAGLPRLGDQELRDMGEIYGSRCRLLRGAEATPTGFIESNPGQYSLIHLSAHAIANRESPLNSYLVLSPGSTGDYKLYAHDLEKMQLKASLVTLSACQSARGNNVPGEGLVGLAWAVLSSGPRNVVASLWPVLARPTAGLMGRFYLHLRAGEPPAQALHSAKLEIARMPGSTAYEWAAFQLYSR